MARMHTCSLSLLSAINMFLLPGDYGGGDIPVPIPNTEVKPSNADDTASRRGGKVGNCQAFFYIMPSRISAREEHGEKANSNVRFCKPNP